VRKPSKSQESKQNPALRAIELPIFPEKEINLHEHAVSVVPGVSPHDVIVILQFTVPIMCNAPYLEGHLLKRNKAVVLAFVPLQLITEPVEWVCSLT